MPHYKLHYFDIRSRGEPIRWLFAVAKQPYEELRISAVEWISLKSSKNYYFYLLCIPIINTYYKYLLYVYLLCLPIMYTYYVYLLCIPIILRMYHV